MIDEKTIFHKELAIEKNGLSMVSLLEGVIQQEDVDALKLFFEHNEYGEAMLLLEQLIDDGLDLSSEMKKFIEKIYSTMNDISDIYQNKEITSDV